MSSFLIKTLISALVIASVSELAKRSTLLGAILASLPLVSLLSLVWLYVDGGDAARLSAFSSNVFWMVLPSLAMFLVLPLLLKAQWSFPPALAIAAATTVVAYFLVAVALKRFGYQL